MATNSPHPGAPYNAWTNAARTIQDAVDAAVPGDLVLATNGVYDTGGRAGLSTWITNRVCITSAIAVRSVNGPAYTIIDGGGVYRGVFMANGPTLSGFTIRNGVTASFGCGSGDTSGGGVFSQNRGSIVSNCVITACRACCSGGGVSGVTLANSLVHHNTATNLGFGGGVGGGVHNALVYNCTIVSNWAQESGGGMESGTVWNSIITGNSAPYGPDIDIYMGHTFTSNCLVGGDARFADADYRPAPDSPCIDAGANSYTRGATDLDGCPRTSGATVDQGCYEYPQNAEGALRFDGTDDFVQAPDSPDLDSELGEAMTVEVWFRTTNNMDQILIGKHAGGQNGSYYLGLTGSGAGAVRFMLINSSSGRVDQTFTNGYADGRWHHLAGVYNGTNLRLYYDGSEVGSAVAQSGSVCDTSYPLDVGAYAGSGWRFGGDLDEARLWKSARSLVEIRDTMHRQILADTNLVLHFRFNEVGGARVQDWVTPSRTPSVQLMGPVRTNSGAVMGTSRAQCQQSLRAVWSGRSGVSLDDGNSLAVTGSSFGGTTNYFLWGHDGQSGFAATNSPAGRTGDFQRLKRTWFAERTGTGTGTVAVSLAGAGGGVFLGVQASNAFLLRSAASTGALSVIAAGAAREGAAVVFSNAALEAGSYTVMVGGPVETGPATNLLATSATLQGTVWGWVGSLTNIFFEYGTNVDCGMTGPAAPPAYDGAGACSVSGAVDTIPGSAYRYRLAAYVSNIIIRGSEAFFVAPVTNPVALAASGHAYNSFVANWLGVSGATNYLLDVSTNAAFENVWIGNRSTRTNLSSAVSGMVENVTYYYRVSAQFPEADGGESGSIVVFHPITHSHYIAPTGLCEWPYTNWANAATQLQQAVDAAVTGDTIYAAAGVYDTGGKPGYWGNITNRVCLREGLALIGSGPGLSIIVGAPDPASNFGPAAVRCVYMEGGAFLSGFTLTNGHTEFEWGDVNGGGVFNDYVGLWNYPVVSNCVIAGCEAAGDGGGADGNSHMILRNCLLIGNKAYRGGGAYDVSAWDCAFRQNLATNGGGSDYSMLFSCEISSNTALVGGGLFYCDAHDSTVSVNHAVNGGGIAGGTVSNCLVTGNTASSEGGGVLEGMALHSTIRGNEAVGNGGGAHNSLIQQCRVENNDADMGGGLYGGWAHDNLILGNSAVLRGGGAASAHIYLNTLVSNAALQGGGCYGCTVDSCIVIGNISSTSSNWLGGEMIYSCAQPLPAGIGNTTADPLWVVPFNARLASSSPCIDAGNPTNDLNIYEEFDYFNMGRPLDGNNDGTARADMGCHEYLHAQADSDGDTMLDGWEADRQLYPSIPDDAPLDFDEDGDICSVEYIADTDPWDSNSWFRLQRACRTNSFAVGFIGSTARVYTLYGSTNLPAGTWTAVSGCVERAGSGSNTYLIDTNMHFHGTYRVGVSTFP